MKNKKRVKFPPGNYTSKIKSVKILKNGKLKIIFRLKNSRTEFTLIT